MTQRRIRAIEDSDRILSRSMMGTKAAAKQRSGPEKSPPQAGSEAATEEIRTRIEKLAYELYQRRGRQDGYDRQDWLEAERLTVGQPALASQDSSGRLPTSAQA